MLPNRRLAVCALTAVMMLPLYVACAEKGLSDADAIQLATKELGFPQKGTAVFGGVKADSKVGQEVFRLIREGYLIDAPGGIRGTHYKASDKGKELVEQATYSSLYKAFETIYFLTHEMKIVGVKDRRVDTKEGRARFVFLLAPFITPYGTKIATLDPVLFEKKTSNGIGYSFRYTENTGVGNPTMTVDFRRWDGVWRVE